MEEEDLTWYIYTDFNGRVRDKMAGIHVRTTRQIVLVYDLC